MPYLVPHDNLHTPRIDAIMTIIINVLKLFLPFYVRAFVMTVKRKFGSTGLDLLIISPTTSQPILIERFCGE